MVAPSCSGQTSAERWSSGSALVCSSSRGAVPGRRPWLPRKSHPTTPRVCRAWQAVRMPASPRPARPASRPALSWDAVVLAPMTSTTGAEPLLVDRATAGVLALAREQDAALEVTEVEAAGYRTGQLQVVTSPSLFGESRVVVVHGLEAMTDEFLADALAYLAAPEPDAVLILQHAGGQRGKRLLDAVRSVDIPMVACDPLKRDTCLLYTSPSPRDGLLSRM